MKDVGRILCLVAIDDDVALVIVALADQPTENAICVRRIRDAAVRRPSVPGRDVVLGNGAPEHVSRVIDIRPAFDTRKQALDSLREFVPWLRKAHEVVQFWSTKDSKLKWTRRLKTSSKLY